jgi:phenylpropionate dioxygenase-like ring-hydroxylating dioxygenase large terminal subunit
MMTELTCEDRVALDEWHVVAALIGLPVEQEQTVRLLGCDIALRRGEDHHISARVAGSGRSLPVQTKFGHVWTSLGTPVRTLFAIPEYDEPDRRNVIAEMVPVHVSAPRAVENFLDLGHFAYVHGGYLGAEPHTEIKPYKVTVEQDEVIASGCKAYQPRASLIADQGFEVEYVYRVPHPYCAVLYKSSVLDETRQDVIALFVQPEDEDRITAHMLASVLDPHSSDQEIKDFQQLIFAQDKPILENQIPKLLPLNPRAELWAQADAGSAAYRRWLTARGVRFGTIPA